MNFSGISWARSRIAWRAAASGWPVTLIHMKLFTRSSLLSAAALGAALFTLVSPASAQSTDARAVAAVGRPRALRSTVSESVRTGTLTAADGQVAITSIDRKWDEASGTGTVNEAAVMPDGRIATRVSNLTRDASGTITERGTFTDFDGRSANYTETTKRTSGRPVAVGRMVDADGKVATYETTTSRATRNQTKLTTVITRADGKKETRVEVLDPAKPAAGS